MPTYDYVCDACGHKFELFQSIKDDAIRKCPQCKKLKLRRLFGTGAAIVFKGSGFYQTDYRSDAYKKQASADQAGGEKSSSGGEKSGSEKSSGDAKPAASSASSSSGASGGDKSSSKKKGGGKAE